MKRVSPVSPDVRTVNEMMRTPTKRQRVRDLLASLPPDAGKLPSTSIDADEHRVTLEQDGVTLTGTTWVLPGSERTG